jgi:hypothetical protein
VRFESFEKWTFAKARVDVLCVLPLLTTFFPFFPLALYDLIEVKLVVSLLSITFVSGGLSSSIVASDDSFVKDDAFAAEEPETVTCCTGGC